MKKFAFNLFRKSILPLLALLLVTTAQGAEVVTKNTRTSDTTMLLVLIAFILVLLIINIVIASAIRNLLSNKNLWIKNVPKSLVLMVVFAAGMLVPERAIAAGQPVLFMLSDGIFYLLIATAAFLFLTAIFLARTLQNLLNELSGKKEESYLANLTISLTEAVPVEREAEVMTDHEYDGIRELDNVLPPWWVYLFYATIVFSFVYIIRFHIVGSGNIMAEEYQAEIEYAEAQKAVMLDNAPGDIIDESNVTVTSESSDLSRGQVIFDANCASCHKTSGAGDIGPNLTDNYWLHGGGIKDIFKTIKYGVPDKGMISWQAQIKPDDMRKVASYIVSLAGTNPENAKAPQGEFYVPEETEPAADAPAKDTIATNL